MVFPEPYEINRLSILYLRFLEMTSSYVGLDFRATNGSITFVGSFKNSGTNYDVVAARASHYIIRT